jgi:hypothetical protein
MVERPETCCVEVCGRPTQSHNVAFDVSEHDVVGLPTAAGVVCHRCFTGGTEGAPAIGEAAGTDGFDPNEHIDFDETVLVATPVEVLNGDG